MVLCANSKSQVSQCQVGLFCSLVGLFCLHGSLLTLVHTSDIPEPPSLLGNAPAPLMPKPSDRAGEAASGEQGKGDGGKGGGKGKEGAGRGTQVFVNGLGTACGSAWGTGAEGQGGDKWATEGESFRSTMYLNEQRRLHQDSILVGQFLDLFDELGYVRAYLFYPKTSLRLQEYFFNTQRSTQNLELRTFSFGASARVT